jgi:plastocyanin
VRGAAKKFLHRSRLRRLHCALAVSSVEQGIDMRIATVSLALAATMCASLTPAVADERGPPRRIVTVGFGAGLNTAQPGNPANHHVIPDTVRINVGDVVNFAVGGLHYIRVYGNGVTLAAVKAQIPNECEANPLPPATFPPQCGAPPVPIIAAGSLSVFYEGINPLLSAQPGPPFAQASAATNRVETVAFLQPGRYLVICAVLPHFNDKMYAWIEVRGGDAQNQHDHD